MSKRKKRGPKKRGRGARKGGGFERHICKQLSRWWTGGQRDDVFWRSSQSGGRATQRMKKGLRTYGSYGDIAAVDPIGEPLLKVFTIELKRGRSHGSPGDLIDCPCREVPQPFEQCLAQAMRSAEHAGSHGWMLILRRDCKVPIVCINRETIRALEGSFSAKLPFVRFRWPLRLEREHRRKTVAFQVMLLDDFLNTLNPSAVRTLGKAVAVGQSL